MAMLNNQMVHHVQNTPGEQKDRAWFDVEIFMFWDMNSLQILEGKGGWKRFVHVEPPSQGLFKITRKIHWFMVIGPF